VNCITSYASAIDRLQPFINNVTTQGHTWVRHGVTVDKVYKRMAPVREALPELWSFVDDAINDALLEQNPRGVLWK
jgi:putative hydrolase of HD superfamily